MSIQEKQEQIIAQFARITDKMEQYRHIIETGKQLPPMNENLKTDDKLIRGCQAKVWLDVELKDGKVHFMADSDTLITKGLIALIIQVMDNEPARDILKTDLYFLDRIGLKEHLGPARSNGLLNMIKQVKLAALSAGK
ncbi:MAG: SufE family protein [Bacteroidia bacterium]|nr:SufE family protein [Bacteroidia bacterium]MCO5255102.1 SufE family protein [Bacteroidota bacterium]